MLIVGRLLKLVYNQWDYNDQRNIVPNTRIYILLYNYQGYTCLEALYKLRLMKDVLVVALIATFPTKITTIQRFDNTSRPLAQAVG